MKKFLSVHVGSAEMSSAALGESMLSEVNGGLGRLPDYRRGPIDFSQIEAESGGQVLGCSYRMGGTRVDTTVGNYWYSPGTECPTWYGVDAAPSIGSEMPVYASSGEGVVDATMDSIVATDEPLAAFG